MCNTRNRAIMTKVQITRIENQSPHHTHTRTDIQVWSTKLQKIVNELKYWRLTINIVLIPFSQSLILDLEQPAHQVVA